MNLTDIKLRPFLQDIADNDFLGGTANIEMALTGAGPTSDAILQSLNGQTKLNVSKGKNPRTYRLVQAWSAYW